MTKQLAARRYMEQNGCASFRDDAPKVHFLLWESIDKAHEKHLRSAGFWCTGTSILMRDRDNPRLVRGWTPTICSQNRLVRIYHNAKGGVTKYRAPLVTSEPSKVTCMVCLTKLVMLGISCGCVED